MTANHNGNGKDQPRFVVPKSWQDVAVGGVMALAAMPALAQSQPLTPRPPFAAGGQLWLAQAEGGEGGEAGAVAGVSPDVAYLARLAIVEGHLVAALDLYRKGLVDEAIGLSWHPEAEMMAEVRTDLAARGAADVTPAMAEFSAKMEAGAPLPEVEKALAAAHALFAAAAAPKAGDLRLRADALILLLRAAAHEYEESIEGGQVSDLFAYHEAHAFVAVARELVRDLAANPAAKDDAEKALAALDGAEEAFGDMSKTVLEARDPAIMLAVAARVELALSAVR